MILVTYADVLRIWNLKKKILFKSFSTKLKEWQKILLAHLRVCIRRCAILLKPLSWHAEDLSSIWLHRLVYNIFMIQAFLEAVSVLPNLGNFIWVANPLSDIRGGENICALLISRLECFSQLNKLGFQTHKINCCLLNTWI